MRSCIVVSRLSILLDMSFTYFVSSASVYGEQAHSSERLLFVLHSQLRVHQCDRSRIESHERSTYRTCSLISSNLVSNCDNSVSTYPRSVHSFPLLQHMVGTHKTTKLSRTDYILDTSSHPYACGPL